MYIQLWRTYTHYQEQGKYAEDPNEDTFGGHHYWGHGKRTWSFVCLCLTPSAMMPHSAPHLVPHLVPHSMHTVPTMLPKWTIEPVPCLVPKFNWCQHCAIHVTQMATHWTGNEVGSLTSMIRAKTLVLGSGGIHLIQYLVCCSCIWKFLCFGSVSI